jgi:hypothetical protein
VCIASRMPKVPGQFESALGPDFAARRLPGRKPRQIPFTAGNHSFFVRTIAATETLILPNLMLR